MIARARLLCVVAILAVGAIGVISSTQTWLVVDLDDGASSDLLVAGAAAVPVLAPLSLATLALGAALSIVGLVLRLAFGVLTLLLAGSLGLLCGQVAFAAPVWATASTVTAATGITGDAAVAALVAAVTTTPWPAVTVVASVVLLAAGVFVLATGVGWRGSGRRYRADAASPAGADAGAAAAPSRPHDAIDSWDDLSRGSDPTA